ncbi:MAG: T9SS type A sorting domain-containing protein [Mameliella sp.]|nr:T9SS type A sorting domain-containing protein [Phaeodactylibacter sp.]
MDLNSYTIYNINGQSILSGVLKGRQTIIETQGWQSGIYFAKVRSKTGRVYTEKILLVN